MLTPFICPLVSSSIKPNSDIVQSLGMQVIHKLLIPAVAMSPSTNLASVSLLGQASGDSNLIVFYWIPCTHPSLCTISNKLSECP